MQDIDAIAEQVSVLIYNSPQHSISGSTLSPLIQRAFPGFDPVQFGCINLRDFLRRYAKDVFEAGRSGQDIVYSVLRLPSVAQNSARDQEVAVISHPPALRPSAAIDRPVWKTFVSPAGKFRAYGNRDTGDLRITHAAEQPLGGPWVEIPSCPPDIHLQIAKDFVGGLTEGATKTELGKILGLNAWWEPFFVTTRSLGIQKQWASFRRRALHIEFRRALDKIGVPFATNPGRVPPPTTTPGTLQDGTNLAPPADDALLRQIATEIIQKLPLSDLREVWLPLGRVLDEARKR